MRKPTTHTGHVLLLGAALILTACGKSDSVSGADAASAGNIAAEQPDGLPDGLRDDVPVHPGLEIASVTMIGDGFELSGTANDSIEQLGAFYEDSFDEHGWTLDANRSDTVSASARVYEVTKNDRAVTVVLASTGGKTQVEMRTKNAPVY